MLSKDEGRQLKGELKKKILNERMKSLADTLDGTVKKAEAARDSVVTSIEDIGKKADVITTQYARSNAAIVFGPLARSLYGEKVVQRKCVMR